MDEQKQWTFTEISGVRRFMAETDKGDRFAIWCTHTARGTTPVLEMRLEGNLPSPGELVRLLIDHSMIRFHADNYGLVRIDCLLCIDQTVWLWEMLRGGSLLQVIFDDGSHSSFRLKGTRTVFGAKPCTASSQVASHD